ncbi:MAG: hypothetical protein DRP59_00755 [Spirochaetes bacterium]|nr:MAG: hypothetical protein DRP59_00755 [Spirochaetota bacterium]
MKKSSIAILIFGMMIIAGCVTSNTSTSITENTGTADTQKIEDQKKFNSEPAYVAITDFSILAKDKSLDFLSTEIPNDLSAGFVKGGLIKPVERQELDKAIKELKLSMSGLTDEEYSLKAGKLLGAKYILLGSMSKIGDQIKISCRLIETETAEIVYTESARGLYSDIFDVEDELKGKIESFFQK